MSNGDLALKKIGNAVMIVDSKDSEGVKALFEKFPPPAEVIFPASGWRTRVETLRTFVSNVLPDKSSPKCKEKHTNGQVKNMTNFLINQG